MTPPWCILLVSSRRLARWCEGTLHSSGIRGSSSKALLRFLLAGILLAGTVEYGWGAAASQAAAVVQGSPSAEPGTPSSQNAPGHNSPTTPQNPPPQKTNPSSPGQSPEASQQNPPPSAQLPEPAIENPEVRPAPKPALAPPALTI